jgi:two-component system nitrate/nitrite sensor histidine kinase NarX
MVETAQRGARCRVLLALIGLLLVLGIAGLLFMTGSGSAFAAMSRILLAVMLLLAGASLTAVIMLNMRKHDAPAGNPAPPRSESEQPAPPAESRQGNGGMNERYLEENSLQVLYEVVSGINSAHGLDDLLTRFLFTLKRITHAHATAIWVTQNPGKMELSASSGIDESVLLNDRQDVRRCLYERAVTEGKIWVERSLDKCEKSAGRRFFEQDAIGLVSVPIRYRGNITGVINLFADVAFIDRIEGIKPLLTSIAHHLSVAIEKYHNDEENREHLINDERTRIAHELHDSLAQSLASLRYQVRVLDETLHQGDESTTWQQLERIENSLDVANTELRGLIANFRAPVYQRGLLDAIEQIVSQFRNETRINTYLQKEWSGKSIPKDVETQILRIIQEALWNIRKHSQAKTVRILLRDGIEGKYSILIEDDGVGINKQVYGSPGEHIGLAIMQERALRLGGKLRVESEPGEGTRIVLELEQPDTESSPS